MHEYNDQTSTTFTSSKFGKVFLSGKKRSHQLREQKQWMAMVASEEKLNPREHQTGIIGKNMPTQTLHARIEGIEHTSMQSNFLWRRSTPYREMIREGI